MRFSHKFYPVRWVHIKISYKFPNDLFEMNVLDDDNKRAVVVTAVVKWLYGSAYNAHNTFAIERSTNMYRIA